MTRDAGRYKHQITSVIYRDKALKAWDRANLGRRDGAEYRLYGRLRFSWIFSSQFERLVSLLRNERRSVLRLYAISMAHD